MCREISSPPVPPQGRASRLVSSSYELAKLLDSYIRATAAGIDVTHDEALKCPAVAVSIKVISESVAQLPFNVFFEGPDGSKEVVKSNPAHKLLSTHGKPNNRHTSFEFRRLMTRQVALCGNAYALKQKVGGTLDGLVFIHPRRVTVEESASGELMYKVAAKDGRQLVYGQDDIFHLRGETDDGVTGIDPIQQNAESIALALAQDRFAGKMFSNGVKPSGVIEFPHTFKDEAAYKRLKESFEAAFSGADNAHKAIILENGAKWNSVSMTLEDAQLLDSRKLQRSIVASLFRIPPHMIGDLDKSTFSNIENLARQFVDYALMPWLDMWQQAIEQQLFTRSQQVSHIAKFNVSGLLRGDAKTRSDLYASAIIHQWMSPNEVREKEDMNPREGGDEFINPNITPTQDKAPKDEEPAKSENPE
jgi:HK97 family phage portal protein